MRQPFHLIVFMILVMFDAVTVHSLSIFTLTDSDPDSPAFRRRFMASHGVNEAIEPKLTTADRPLQEAIMPLIRDNPRQAIQRIEEALKPDTNPAFLNILGNLYYQVNDYTNSERYLRRALEQFPSLRRAWRTLALGYVQRDMISESIEPLLKVIEFGGGDAQSYGLLAYAYLNAQKYESALAAYRMARMFDPDSFDFRRGQAMCLLQTNQNHSAIALFDELIAEKPEEPSFWGAQANAFLNTEQTDKAIANLQMMADSGKSNWESLIMLGDLYLNKSIPKLALESYTKAFRQHAPNNLSQTVRPLTYLVNRKHFEEAQAYYKLLQPDLKENLTQEIKTQVNTALARIEMSIGNPEKALAILTATIEENPLDGASLMLLGEYHLDSAEYEEAEYFFERATSVRDFESEAYIALGRLEVQRGNLKSALIPLRKAQQLKNTPNLQHYVESIERALDLRY